MSSTMTSALKPDYQIRRIRESGECADVVGKADFAAIGRGEPEARFRRHVVHDLHHGAAFVRAAGRILEDNDRLGIAKGITAPGQVARGDVERSAVRRRVRVITVRHEPNGDAAAVHAGGKLIRHGAARRPGWWSKPTLVIIGLVGTTASTPLLPRDAQERFGRHIGFNDARAIVQVRCSDFDTGRTTQILQNASYPTPCRRGRCAPVRVPRRRIAPGERS